MLHDSSHVAGGLPIFIMAGVSSLASIWLRDTHARSAARGGLVALIVGVGLALVALNDGSTALFLLATAVAGLGFGPAFAGAFRAISNRAPADQRAALVASVYVASYLAYSLPALAAGIAVTRYGLLDTANVYGVALIALARASRSRSRIACEDPESVAAVARGARRSVLRPARRRWPADAALRGRADPIGSGAERSMTARSQARTEHRLLGRRPAAGRGRGDRRGRAARLRLDLDGRGLRLGLPDAAGLVGRLDDAR